MLPIGYNYQTEALEQALIYKVKPDAELERLFSQLFPDKPWRERKDVAKKLGYMKSQEAVP